jgi:hypothetical protein
MSQGIIALQSGFKPKPTPSQHQAKHEANTQENTTPTTRQHYVKRQARG